MNNKKATILIVDDMPINIQLLSEILAAEYTLKAVTNGQRALDLVKKDPSIDLILLDVVMPDIDGYQICRELKNHPETNKIPIIFVTAKKDVNDEEYGFNLGAVDYISKPFHPIIVKVRIRNQITLKLRSDMLEELALIDGLTQIYNRRYLDNKLPMLFEQSLSQSIPFSIAMIDVDYFKNYNDNYGHGKGDMCLMEVTKSIKESLEGFEDALFARYGGEEFSIVFSGYVHEQIAALLQRIIKAVEDVQIEHDYSLVSKFVTISIGFSGLTSPTNKDSFAKVLLTADKALYQAKSKGRNQLAKLIDVF